MNERISFLLKMRKSWTIYGNGILWIEKEVEKEVKISDDREMKYIFN